LAHVTKIQMKRVDPASISLSLHWLTSLKKINIKPKLISGLNHLFFYCFEGLPVQYKTQQSTWETSLENLLTKLM